MSAADRSPAVIAALPVRAADGVLPVPRAGWLRSPIASVRLARKGRLRRLRRRVGTRVALEGGSEFLVFRDTSVVGVATPRPAVLAVRFHLRFIRPDQRWAHRLFQAVCVITTPFFAGLAGYRTKLWMYSARSGEYAGLYEWDGADRAAHYAEGLVPILRAVSKGGSVSYHVYPGERLEGRLGDARYP